MKRKINNQIVKLPIKRFNRMKWMTMAFFALLIFMIAAFFTVLISFVEQKDKLNNCVTAYSQMYYDKQVDLVWFYNYNNTQYRCSSLLCQNEKTNNCSDIKLSCLSCCIKGG